MGFATMMAKNGFRIAIFDKQKQSELKTPSNDGRDIAISGKTKRILKQIGAWDFIPESEISPIKQARVLNGDADFSLNFNPLTIGMDRLGEIVSNHIIRRAMYKSSMSCKGVKLFAGKKVKALNRYDNIAEIILEDGRVFSAPLVLAADTRFSKIRRDAGIGANMHDFGQTMIVGRMHGSKSHNHIAYEYFRYDGGLAILPLNNDIASIVQTFSGDEAEKFMSMNDKDYIRATKPRLRGIMGEIKPVSERVAYPLVGVYANRFHCHRLALIGDAAVGMHPVTAHGFNFGLQGADILTTHISNAYSQGMDIGNEKLLALYSRDHRNLTWPLYKMTEKMIELYSKNTITARMARKAALRIAELSLPIKDILMARLGEVPVAEIARHRLASLPKLPKPPKL